MWVINPDSKMIMLFLGQQTVGLLVVVFKCLTRDHATAVNLRQHSLSNSVHSTMMMTNSQEYLLFSTYWRIHTTANGAICEHQIRHFSTCIIAKFTLGWIDISTWYISFILNKGEKLCFSSILWCILLFAIVASFRRILGELLLFHQSR